MTWFIGVAKLRAGNDTVYVEHEVKEASAEFADKGRDGIIVDGVIIDGDTALITVSGYDRDQTMLKLLAAAEEVAEELPTK